jgi:glycosyltransferase involved in cell wall biosynthesis
MDVKKFPLISVLTPVRNMGEFIENNIKSVLSQDYKNIEHIIQDNLSTDNTTRILEKYSKHIKWASESDSGQADGLNRALQRSEGDIIIVLNADDELMPSACSQAVRNFQLFPDYAVIYGDKYNIDENGVIKYTYFGPEPYNFLRIFCVQDIIPAQAAFIDRKCFESSGFFFDRDLPTCPDFEAWIRIGLKHNMKHVPGIISGYRMHSGSESQNAAVISGMVDSKLSVINKYSDEVKRKFNVSVLKRSRSGLFYWAAANFLRLKEKRLFIKFLFLAFMENPLTFVQSTGIILKKLLKRLAD